MISLSYKPVKTRQVYKKYFSEYYDPTGLGLLDSGVEVKVEETEVKWYRNLRII